MSGLCCLEDGEDGESCTSTSQCLSGYCRYDQSRSEAICQPEPPPQICEVP